MISIFDVGNRVVSRDSDERGSVVKTSEEYVKVEFDNGDTLWVNEQNLSFEDTYDWLNEEEEKCPSFTVV